jgi:ketosteroid isomerase-like protein
MQRHEDTERGAAELMRLHLERISSDIEGWLELFADDAVVEFPYAASVGRDGRLAGKPAIAGYFRGTPGTFRGLQFRGLRLHVCADPQVAVAEVHGSARVGPRGAAYEQDYVMVLQARAGQIVAYREYWDPTPAIAAFAAGEVEA